LEIEDVRGGFPYCITDFVRAYLIGGDWGAGRELELTSEWRRVLT